jgi:hypothetical protein
MHAFARAPSRVGLAAALLGVAAVSAGCGGDPPSYPVSGTVTVGGLPLKRGQITFVSTVGKKDPFSALIEDGKYKTDQPIPAGLCKVTITSLPERPGAGGGDDMAPAAKQKGAKKKERLVPHEKYSNAGTSGLEYTVVRGENTYNPPDLERADN